MAYYRVLGRVAATPTKEEPTALLQRLPDRPMTAGLVTKLKNIEELVQESPPKEIRGALLEGTRGIDSRGIGLWHLPDEARNDSYVNGR